MIRPGLAVGLARLEVQERVEKRRLNPATGRMAPGDDTLHRMLRECSTHMVMTITGWDYRTVMADRKRLDVKCVSDGHQTEFMRAASRLAHRRWPMWHEHLPPVLSREELEAAILAEMQRVQGQPVPTPPLTTGDVLVQIRRFKDEQFRWPTNAELAVVLNRNKEAISEKVRLLYQQGYVDRDGLTIIAITNMPPAGELKKEQWTPEQIAAHLAAIIPKPQRVLTGGQRPQVQPPATEPQPIPEVNIEVAVTRPAPAPAWPPSDEDLLAIELEVKHTGGWIIPTLTNRYGITSKEANEALKAAHDRAKTPAAAPATKLAAEPAPTPAPELTVAKPQGGKPGKSKLPGDAELVAEADAIRARGENVFNVLAEKYGVRGGQLWTKLGDARERQGLPRKMGVPTKLPPKEELWPLFVSGVPVAELAKKLGADPSAVYYHRANWIKAGSPGLTTEQPAPTAADQPAAPLTEYLCAECADTGFLVGGHSHEFCTCPEGQLRRAAKTETIQPDPGPVPQAVVAAEAVQAPTEANPPAGEAEPPASPTERSGRTHQEMTDDVIRAQQVMIAELNQSVEDLEDQLNRVCAEKAALMGEMRAPILLLWNGDRMRQVPAPAGPLLKVGDHYAEPIDVGGHQRYAIWQCVAEGTINGDHPLRILRLVLDTTAVGKEAA